MIVVLPGPTVLYRAFRAKSRKQAKKSKRIQPWMRLFHTRQAAEEALLSGLEQHAYNPTRSNSDICVIQVLDIPAGRRLFSSSLATDLTADLSYSLADESPHVKIVGRIFLGDDFTARQVEYRLLHPVHEMVLLGGDLSGSYTQQTVAKLTQQSWGDVEEL